MQYKIRADGYGQIRKSALWRRIPVLVIAAATGIFISWSGLTQTVDDTNVLPIVIPILALIIGIGIFRGISRQKVLYAGYTLTVADNMITREQFNTPVIALYFNEVEQIIQYRNGNILAAFISDPLLFWLMPTY